jgi:hypothetical protein
MNSNTLIESAPIAATRRHARMQIHLSTLVVAVLTSGGLLGINMRPFHFYYPRPEWVEELKDFDKTDNQADPFCRWGLYGWPFPAFPSWSWFGNFDGAYARSFPDWGHYSSKSDIHIACNYPKWNSRALWIDIVVNLSIILAVSLAWEIYMRKRSIA